MVICRNWDRAAVCDLETQETAAMELGRPGPNTQGAWTTAKGIFTPTRASSAYLVNI